MLRGIYTSASGMIVQMDKEDVLSNNLANVDTTGFKKDQTIIKEFPGFEIFRKDDERVISSNGDIESKLTPIGKLGTGAIVKDVFTNFEQGTVLETGNTNDFALNGEGFFAVDTPNGAKLTRSGNFYIDSNNWTTKFSSNNSNVINSNEKTEITVTQNSHGFSFGNLVRFSSNWQKARANVLTNYSLGVVSEVVDSNTFKICLSGYLSGFTGLTSNTLYYLSETIAGDYTDVKSDILKQPMFFSISTTEAIILQWSPSFIDLLQNNEYVVSNNGVLSFTNKSGFYKLIEKNNVLNEIDIKYSTGDSYVTLIVKNMSSLFSDTKDITSKINIYIESTSVKIQNLTGFMKTLIIKKII